VPRQRAAKQGPEEDLVHHTTCKSRVSAEICFRRAGQGGGGRERGVRGWTGCQSHLQDGSAHSGLRNQSRHVQAVQKPGQGIHSAVKVLGHSTGQQPAG
jgi:hypothetical protein